MIEIETIVARGALLPPVPVGLGLLGAERFIRQRFENERAVIRIGNEAVGTGLVDFDLRPESEGVDEMLYRAAVMLGAVEINVGDLFQTAELARLIREVPFLVASAAGGNPIFQVRSDVVVGLKVR